MKRISAVMVSLVLLATGALFAEKKNEVLMKFSSQGNLMRIVFEADEAFIKSAKSSVTPFQIKVEFSEPFTLPVQANLPFEVIPTDKSVVVNLKEKSEIKQFTLSSPARIVFDVQKKDIQAVKEPAKEVEKPADKQPVAPSSRVYVIDAGHGGYDFGIMFGNTNEKELSLQLAKELHSALSKKGRKGFLVRQVDQYLSIMERVQFANQKNPDVFISLHASSSGDFVIYSPTSQEQASGEPDAMYSVSSRQKKYIGRSRILSESIGKALKNEFNVTIQRREMPMPILDSAGAPAVLIELPSPKVMGYDQQAKTRLVNAVINGLMVYWQSQL